jgi:hypothetical protein
MDYNEFSLDRQRPPGEAAHLSAEDVATLSRLMLELRDVTLSRASYLAATDFLKRFGFDADGATLVRPEQVAR